jgi:hypothetical protein
VRINEEPDIAFGGPEFDTSLNASVIRITNRITIAKQRPLVSEFPSTNETLQLENDQEKTAECTRARILSLLTLPVLLILPLMTLDAYVASNSPFSRLFETSAVPSLLLVVSLVPCLKLGDWLGDSRLLTYGTASVISVAAAIVQIAALAMTVFVSKP